MTARPATPGPGPGRMLKADGATDTPDTEETAAAGATNRAGPRHGTPHSPTPSTTGPGATAQPATPGPGRLLKVCGATGIRDVETAAAGGADCVGLWHGVPRGPRELDLATLSSLSAAARDAGLLPAWVTFRADAPEMARTALTADVGWVQLHAYQPPSVVRELRQALPDSIGIVKVLHVGPGGGCVERPLLGAYARAGTDLFLLDTASGDGRVGSTGLPLDPDGVTSLLPLLPRPFLLAGGLTATARPAYDEAVAHPGFRGVDVDTAARAPGGTGFALTRVTALARAWQTDGARALATRTHSPKRELLT